MALGKTDMTLAVVLVTIFFWAAVCAQSNCASAILLLSPCLIFNVGNSSSPSSSCCSQLASMVQTTPLCLCDVMNGSGAEVLGLVLNRTLAQALPGACNVQTSPLTECYNDNAGLGSQSDDGAYSDGVRLKISQLLAIFLTFITSLRNIA